MEHISFLDLALFLVGAVWLAFPFVLLIALHRIERLLKVIADKKAPPPP